MTGGRKRSSARIWALGMGLIVLVIGAALMGGLSMRLGVTPAPQIHRTGTAVVTAPCERDPLNLLMYRCQAQVESWTATAASAPDLDPAMTVTVYSAKPLQGPVTIQSHPPFAGDGREA